MISTFMHDPELYRKIIARVELDKAAGCWIWTGPSWKNRPHPGNRYGYITVRYNGKYRAKGVHRMMMIAIHGPQPPHICACHTCDNVLCVNPDHLFLGTMKQNIHDSRAKGRHYESRKDFCDRGHPLFGDNLYSPMGKDGKPKRVCRTCSKAGYRMRMGWPEHLAYDMSIKVPMGHTINRETGAFERIDFASYRRRARTALTVSGDS